MADLNLTRLALRAALALPKPILRALSGGSAVVRGGRTLDPGFQFLFYVAPAAAPGAVADERAAVSRNVAMTASDPEPGVRWEDFAIDGPGGALPVRLYRPPRQDPAAPMMVYAHGGGGVIGDLMSSQTVCSIIAAVARTAVLSVDYRLAPEHRFPAAIEDVAAAWRWACENAERHGARPDVAAVGGDAAGGNLAAVLCQELRRLGVRQPVLQLLISAPLDIANEPQSMRLYGEVQPASHARVKWARDHYLGAEADPTDLRLSPALNPDLTGLAPAVIAVGGFDPTLDQCEAYARALSAAGVSVTYRCYDSLAHGFTVFGGVIPAAQAATRQIAGLVRDALAEIPSFAHPGEGRDPGS